MLVVLDGVSMLVDFIVCPACVHAVFRHLDGVSMLYDLHGVSML